jgi:hypothetical protein
MSAIRSSTRSAHPLERAAQLPPPIGRELGEFDADLADPLERSYPAGTAFVDPGKKSVHTAFNPTDGVTVLVATFFGMPETGPLSITEGIEAPDDCPIEVGSLSSR